ncbi:MAG: hypothetical protein AB7Q97_09805 [Gammaproteobacteria bacterium]
MTSRIHVLLAAALVLCALAYAPGLGGSFAFDDFPNIVENDAIQIRQLDLHSLTEAALTGTAGPLKRPLSMMSFAVNYAFAGLQPLAYKITNLAIHLLNGLLLFALLRTLLAAAQAAGTFAAGNGARIAAACAALWLLHPLNLTTVLMVVQRMNSLAALFTLLALLGYCTGRLRSLTAGGGLGFALACLTIGTGLSALCKENGVLTPLYAFIIEIAWLRGRGLATPARRVLAGYYGLVLALPALAGAAWLILSPGWIQSNYAIRPFTLAERLLTEARVMWFYLQQALLPVPRELGLFHDDYPISRGLFQPWQTAVAVLGLAALAAAAALTWRRVPVVAFAIGWFLGGHLLESSVLPLELVHEHRNYLPLVGPLLAGVIGAHALAARAGLQRVPQLLGVGFVVLFAGVTGARALAWSDPIDHAISEVQHHPQSLRANYEMGRVYLVIYQTTREEALADKAQAAFERAAALDPQAPLSHFALLRLNGLRGRPPPPALVAELRRRLGAGDAHPSIAAAFLLVVTCQERGECALDPNDMIGLFGAFLANPSMSQDLNRSTMALLARYYNGVLRDPVAARRVLEDIVAMDPGDCHRRLDLLTLMISMGDLDAARRESANVRAIMDTSPICAMRPVFRSDLERLDAAIAEHAALAAVPADKGG